MWFVCLDKISSLEFIQHFKSVIKLYIQKSINTSSSSSKSVVESKTAETYYGTLERIFESDFLTGSLCFTDLFQNDNPTTFIKKRHLFYDKTNVSKSNNAQPALKKLFEFMASYEWSSCDCPKCTSCLNLLRKKTHAISNICGHCLCGDKLHEGKAFGCHSIDKNGKSVCLGSKKCSSCNYRLPLCCYSKMFQGIKQKYELENIITQQLYLCNKCFFKNNINEQWGHQKNATTLHKTFYHTNKMKRKKRKLKTQVPKNNQVLKVTNKSNLASHRKTANYIKNYFYNLKKSLAWVKERKQEYKSNYHSVIKKIQEKIERSSRLSSTEITLLRNIVAKYEVIDKSFLKFQERKKYVLVPKKMKRIELKENKCHIIYLSNKKRHKKRKIESVVDEEDNEVNLNVLTKSIKIAEEQKRKDTLFLWGLDRKKKKPKTNHFKRMVQAFEDSFEEGFQKDFEGCFDLGF